MAGLAAAGSLSAASGAQARSLTVKDEGYVHLVHSSGSLLIDEGNAKGTLPGRLNVHFSYNGDPSVSAQITIYSHAGTIHAHATAKLSNPSSTAPSFKGALAITSGSGRYSHAHGSGTLYGVFYRRSYAITVQTDGTLRY